MRKTLSTLVLLSLTVAVLAAQGPWRTPPGSSGKMRIASTAADALCAGSTAVSPASGACTGGVYAGPIHAAGLIDATTAGALGNKPLISIATGTQHNFSPGTGISGNTVIRIDNASALDLTGFPAGVNGQSLELFHTTSNLVQLYPDNGGSTAGNRLTNFITSAPTPLAANGHVRYIYESTLAHWRMVEYEQGSWLAPAYVEAQYYGDASGDADWDVSAEHQVWYQLVNRTLTVSFSFSNATVTNTPSTLQFTVPGGFGALRDAYNTMIWGQGTGGAGVVSILSGTPTVINLKKTDYPIAAAWSNSAGASVFRGLLEFEVN